MPEPGPELRSAVGTVLDWPVPHAAAAVVAADGDRAGRGRRAGAGVPAGLGDEAARGLRRAHRRRGGRRRAGTTRRAPTAPRCATWSRTPPGVSFDDGVVQAKPGVRRIYSNSGLRAARPTPSPPAPGCRSTSTCDEAVLEPLRMTLDAAGGLAGGGRRLDGRGPGALRRGAAGPDARVGRDGATRRPPLSFPGLDGDPARLRAAEAERLGAGLRDPRRQVAALDGREQLAADVRALRAVGHVPVGGPGRRRRRAWC